MFCDTSSRLQASQKDVQITVHTVAFWVTTTCSLRVSSINEYFFVNKNDKQWFLSHQFPLKKFIVVVILYFAANCFIMLSCLCVYIYIYMSLWTNSISEGCINHLLDWWNVQYEWINEYTNFTTYLLCFKYLYYSFIFSVFFFVFFPKCFSLCFVLSDTYWHVSYSDAIDAKIGSVNWICMYVCMYVCIYLIIYVDLYWCFIQ